MTQFAQPYKVVVLYSAGHLGSAMTMNRLIDMDEIEVVGVVKAQPLSLTRQGKSAIKRHLKRVGWRFAWLLFFQRIVQGIGYGLSMAIPGAHRGLMPAWKIARERNIPVFRCGDVNNPASVEFVRQCEPDLLVSAYFSQILKAEMIKAPRLGVLNIHPGWLPAYRGAMTYFWVLHDGVDRGGVTVHSIDEGIDTGQVLARRSFPVPEHATQETVLTFTAAIGTHLLGRVVRRLRAGRLEPISTPDSNDPHYSYYPMPGDKAFASYFRRHRFFRIRDVLGLIAFRGLRRRRQ